jgi:hypothetical protein
MNSFRMFFFVSFLLNEKMAPLEKFRKTQPPRRLLQLPSVMYDASLYPNHVQCTCPNAALIRALYMRYQDLQKNKVVHEQV